MQTPVFTIETVMEKEDYRKFLFIATLLRNAYTIPLIAGIALLGAFIATWRTDSFAPGTVIILWIFMFLLVIGIICLKIERKNKQRMKSDKTGTFGAKNILKFYPDHMVVETPFLQGTCTLRYDQFYQLLESKDYLIFYWNQNQASLMKKSDISDLDGFKSFLLEKFCGKYRRILHAKSAKKCE